MIHTISFQMWQNEIDPDNTYRDNGTLNTDIYLKNTSLTKEILVALGGTTILFVMGIRIYHFSTLRKSTNNDNYERLCALDERLRGNLGRKRQYLRLCG